MNGIKIDSHTQISFKGTATERGAFSFADPRKVMWKPAMENAFQEIVTEGIINKVAINHSIG